MLRTPWGDLDAAQQRLTMPEQYEILRGQVSRRRFLQGAAATGALSLVSPTLWRQSAQAASVPALSPHLLYGADPRTQMALSWATPEAVKGAAVRYRPIGARTWSAPFAAEHRAVPGVQTAYHHVRLRGLAPGSSFEYVIGEPGRGVRGTFKTAPASPRPFRFTAFGDQGVSEKAAAVTAAVAAQKPDFHFHVGDLCYAYRTGGAEPETLPEQLRAELLVAPDIWDDWLAQIRGVASRVPWMVTVGNHEMEPGYGVRGYERSLLSRFSLPGNGVRVGGEPVVTYSFDYSNVRFIALDANDANYEIPGNQGYLSGKQERWLEERLRDARRRANIDWIVVGYHQCSYCTNLLHASDQGLRDRWDGLFRRYEVDLVVNGHNHSYERAHPKLAESLGPLDVIGPKVVHPAKDGTTFITAGSGGNPRVELSAHPMSYVTVEGGYRVPEPAPWSVARYLDLSFITVDVTPRTNGKTTMRIRAVKPDDRKPVDAVTLVRP